MMIPVVFKDSNRKGYIMGLEGGSKVKSTGCSYRGLGFNSQHPFSGSQPPVSPVPEDLMPSSALHRDQVHTWQIDIHAD